MSNYLYSYSQAISQSQMIQQNQYIKRQQQYNFQQQLQLQKQLQKQQYQLEYYQLQQQQLQQQQYAYPIQNIQSLDTFASITAKSVEEQYKISPQLRAEEPVVPVIPVIPVQQQLTDRDVYLEKQFIFDTITFYNQQRITFGNYVVQKIINSYNYSIFKKKLNEYTSSRNIILSSQEKDSYFHNKEYLPYLKNRLKQSNHIEILIHSSNCESFLRNIVRAFSKGGYNIEEKQRGDIMKISEYSDINLEHNKIYLNSIIITVQMDNTIKPFIIKLNMFIANIPDYVPLEIPYGLFTTEKSYMTMSYDSERNEIYEIQSNIANKEECIMKIKRGITTYMPYYNYSKLPKMLESLGTTSYTIDFNLSNGKYSDFAITNISKDMYKNTSKDSTQQPLCCTKCNTEILSSYVPSTQSTPQTNSQTQFGDRPKFAITKCCARNYHFDCLFENYVEDGTFKCDNCNCNFINPDTLGKNKEILLCLMGYFE